MKKLLLTTALALLTALYAWAYADFSVVSGGNTLYYEITDTENKEVAVVNETGNPTNPYTTKPIGILIIPETVTNGRTTYTVTSIGDYAFYECDSLTEVTIGNSVTTIGVCAFYGCKSLTEVTIPNSVTSIVGSAFSNCDSLTEVTIPNSVTTIGGSAFNETAWLKNQTDEFVIVGNGILIKYNGAGGSVTIPNSVTSIGDGAFYECKSLTEVTIGNSVTNIGNVAFYDCDSLTKVTIPNSVTSIGQSAFQNCDSLTEVTIGNSVKSIGDRTFYECKSLKEITIGNSVTSIGECAFQNCDSLTEVTIPNSVKSIGVMAFYECKSLTKVTIGNSVTSIGESAFLNCDSLKKVTIGNSVTTIGSGAFYGCSGLTEVINYATKPQDIINSNVFPMERYKITISVPAGSVEAYEAADEWKDFKIKAYIDFAATTTEGYELEYVVNDDSTAVSCVGMVSKVGEGSVNLAIPSSVTHEGVTYAVTNIGERAFYGCESLSTVAIPSSVTEIGAKAFTECTGLSAINVDANNANYCVEDGILYNKTQDVLIACPAGKTGELTITNSVTSIEPYAFFVCSGLTGDLIIGNSVTTIGSYAFLGCSNFNGSLIIGKSVTTIGSYAFKDCSGLKSLTIPNSVKTIEHSAFANCSGLKRIINHSIYPQDLENYEADQTHAFGGIEMDSVILYAPESCIYIYKYAPIWKEFKNIEAAQTVTPIDDITIDLDSAFTQIDLLDYFTIKDDSKIEFIVQSDNPEVVTATLNGNKFGVIPISVGKTNIKIVAKSEYGIESQVDFTVTVTDEKGTSSGCVFFTVIEDVIPVKCPGDETGSISLQVSGNTAPYKFRWSNTQTGNEIKELIAGEYTVVIRDALGCAETKTYEVEGADFISIEQTLNKPDCGQNDGSIEVNVKGGTAPYSYDWDNGEDSPTISNLYSGVYALTVKDSRKCEYKKTIILDSKVSIEITVDSSKNTKCSSSEKGEIHVSVSGGTAPYTYNWADGGVGSNRTNLDEGIYNLVVTDHNGCTANLSHEIQSTSFLTPAIGLVSVDKLTDNNLIIWQKEETNEIDFYNIYRENPQTKEFEVVGTWDYENIGVFEDLEANTFERSWRYRLQAENDCGDRSKLSKSFKTIHMKSVELTKEGVALTWDDYEGEVYPTYAIHRVFGSEAVLEARVPFHTSYYFDANPPKEVTSYFVAVELPEEFVVEGNRLKAESGPFILAVSNIAEVEINAGGGNDDETSLNSVLNQISVYPTVAKDVINVTVGAGQQAQVSLYTLTGEKVYEQEVLETAELNVSNMPNGVYTVVVTINGVGYGYKIIVND